MLAFFWIRRDSALLNTTCVNNILILCYDLVVTKRPNVSKGFMVIHIAWQTPNTILHAPTALGSNEKTGASTIARISIVYYVIHAFGVHHTLT